MKKKSLLIATTAVALSFSQIADAQISRGGLPLTMQKEMPESYVPVLRYERPDWEAYLAKEQTMSPERLFAQSYKVGLHVNTDISFPASGVMTTLPDGSRVWRAAVEINQVPAMGFLFDRFHLPKGVKLFFTNENLRQVAGAFDASNNDESGVFAVDAIQGEKVFIEMNIDPNVDINQIDMHVNQVLVFFRAVEHLDQYLMPIDAYDNQLNGSSSICNINAICPQGADYANSRKATVQTIDMLGGGACSATLVNNTGNTPQNCTPYILTATHCQGSGTMNNNAFSQMLVRFNFERPDCAGTGATNGRSMVGVNLKARANYNESWDVDDIKGDFMVYELKEAIPPSYGAVLAGWNRNPSIQQNVAAPKKFIGFHHPNGDNKKLTTSQSIQSQSWPSTVPNANGERWFQFVTEGYLAPGSSGSGLFDFDGRLIGVASVASITNQVPNNCFVNSANQEVYAMDVIWYDKLSHGWDYAVDGNATNRKISPWLDPANTGATSINAVTSSCTPLGTTSVNVYNDDLDAMIAVHPNPSSDGTVYMQYNFRNATDFNVEVVDIAGRKVSHKGLTAAIEGTLAIDLTDVPNGMYFIKVSAANGYATKKVVINR